MNPESAIRAAPTGARRRAERAARLSPHHRIDRIAALAAALFPGGGILIRWQFDGESGAALEPRDSPLRPILERAVAAADLYAPRQDGDTALAAPEENSYRNGASGAADAEAPLVVCARASLNSAADGAVTTACAAPARNQTSVPHAIAAMASEAAAAAIRAASAEKSRDFWRAHARDLAERLARVETSSRERDDERKSIDAAAAALARLGSRNRYAHLGARFAAIGPFEAWIVALESDGTIRAVASQGVLIPATPLENSSALAVCMRTGKTAIWRPKRARRGPPRPEDRLFARFESYACVPCGRGAVALASRLPIEPRAVARAEALAERAEPIMARWRAEAERERLERLVGALGMRLYGAVDAERARIARDLHDHQAQLLAAARIALEAGPDEARGVFKQLEDALRLRVRELRPATLGRSSLEDALRYELRRIADAGIRGRLMRPERIGKLTRPVQQLCYQVAREALANVVRHAEATHVEISVEKRGRIARLSILDNGRGIPETGGRKGMGLSGLTERLALMGGRLKVESKRGSTRLIAEIPEPA
jgi:signal transduction histidine kinase